MGDSSRDSCDPCPSPLNIGDPNKNATTCRLKEITEHDRFLPIANVDRIMRNILPPNARISKEAKKTMQECASEFISFVTGEASQKCQKEKRKTINGGDILGAMTEMGFEDYANSVEAYLQKYKETEGEKLSATTQGLLDHFLVGANHCNNGRVAISDQHQHQQFVVGPLGQNHGSRSNIQPLKMLGAGSSTDPGARGSGGS